jgi:anti-anti-sigma regulatory factor
MKEERLQVPFTHYEAWEAEENFIDKLHKFAHVGTSICLDFQNVIYISSIVLGSIIWTAKHSSKVPIRFVNVHQQLYEDLERMIGHHLKQFCNGPQESSSPLEDVSVFRNGKWCKN